MNKHERRMFTIHKDSCSFLLKVKIFHFYAEQAEISTFIKTIGSFVFYNGTDVNICLPHADYKTNCNSKTRIFDIKPATYSSNEMNDYLALSTILQVYQQNSSELQKKRTFKSC